MKKLFLVLLVILLSACSSKENIKHLSSDICTVLPAQTDRKKVIDLLGKPNLVKNENTSNETWLYYEVHKSLLKKIPLLSKWGTEEYELVIVGFTEQEVMKCTYRSLTRDEIVKYGVQLNDD